MDMNNGNIIDANNPRGFNYIDGSKIVPAKYLKNIRSVIDYEDNRYHNFILPASNRKAYLNKISLPRKQKRLLRFLLEGKAVLTVKIKRALGIEHTSTLRSIVRATNKNIKKHGLFIRGLYGKPFSGYQLFSR
jgi:hypothetical protein